MCKRIRTLFLVILVALIFSFTSCVNTGSGGDTDDENKIDTVINLQTPTNLQVEVTETMIYISFEQVEKAMGYCVKLYDVHNDMLAKTNISAEDNSISYEQKEFNNGTYYTTVQALGDGTTTYNSVTSGRVSFQVSNGIKEGPVKLATPTSLNATLKDSTLTVKFNRVSNAAGYKVVIKDSNNAEASFADLDSATMTKTFDVSAFKDGVYSVTVMAKGDGEKYLDSAFSSPVNFTVKAGQGEYGKLPIELSKYYKSVEGLTGAALKKGLRTLITSTHKKTTSYADCKTYLQNADQDPNNSSNMLLFYTAESIKKTNNMNIWNREHVWAQSLGWFKTSGAGADLHHIRPCDPKVNSSRGNKKFGTGTSYYTPKDEYKGDVARIIFYLMTRYSESDNYSFKSIAQSQELLVEWNKLDPVSPHEQHRNDYIYTIQGNRNPFIDYPEFVDAIWG